MHTLIWMALYLGAVVAVAVLLFEPLQNAFLANWGFNALILGVLAIGILINVRQVMVLGPEIAWIRMFRTGQTGISLAEEPRLLKPLAKHISGRVKDRFSLSALSLRIVLDGIRSRLDESREVSRYMVGLLVFLGLLGTFWGLLGTISAVVGVIDGLDVGARDFSASFTELKAGLREPLSGMGTAFSSSLFGLGGALILGFMDIQAGHAQNRFFNLLEEWLSSVTQLIEEPGRGEEPVLDLHESSLQELMEELRRTRELIEERFEERTDPPFQDRG